MRHQVFVAISFSLLLLECAPHTNNSTNSPKTTSQTVNATAVPAVSDTLFVVQRCAVFFNPDSVQIARALIEDSESFYTAADDYAYYESEARHYLDSVKIPTLDAHNKKYLTFVGTDKVRTTIRLDTIPSMWGAWFFDPSKKPYEADVIMIDDSYKGYFK